MEREETARRLELIQMLISDYPINTRMIDSTIDMLFQGTKDIPATVLTKTIERILKRGLHEKRPTLAELRCDSAQMILAMRKQIPVKQWNPIAGTLSPGYDVERVIRSASKPTKNQIGDGVSLKQVERLAGSVAKTIHHEPGENITAEQADAMWIKDAQAGSTFAIQQCRAKGLKF